MGYLYYSSLMWKVKAIIAKNISRKCSIWYMWVLLGTERKKNEHFINYQLSVLMEKMRKLKLWFIFQSVILGLEIALRGFRGRSREIMCSVFKEEGGGGPGHAQLIYTEDSQTTSRLLLGLALVLILFYWLTLCSSSALYLPRLLPLLPSSLAYLLPKKCFCLKGKCNKMCLHAFSPQNWLTLAKQLSRRLSKSSVTLPPYCTSPIMYRTVLHDTPCIRKNKDWFTVDPSKNV